MTRATQATGGHGRHRRHRTALLAAIDAVTLVLAALGSAAGAAHAGASLPPIGWTALYLVLAWALIAVRGGYRFRLEVSPFEYFSQVIAGTAIAAMLVITARVLLDPHPAAAGDVVRLWAFASAYLLCARLAIALRDRTSRRHGLNTLIVGAGNVGQTVARRLIDAPHLGLRPIGFLDRDPLPDPVVASGLPVLGASWELEDVVHDAAVEHVIVAFSNEPHEVMLDVVRQCRATGIQVSVVPRLFEDISRHIAVDHLGGIALLRIDRVDPRSWQFECKYAIDRVAGAVLSLAIAPLLGAIAILVKLSSEGPVFFRQPRVGLDAQEFEIVKFRTMRVAEGAREHDAAWASRSLGHLVSEADAPDPHRLTPIGRLLRRWTLDELPQLLNVAKGEMSLVGPRPERVGYVRAFEGQVLRYGDRHRVKSGLSGWAQVHGLRGETPLADRIEYDNYYVENWSPWLDVKILLMTLPAILRGGSGVDDVGAQAPDSTPPPVVATSRARDDGG